MDTGQMSMMPASAGVPTLAAPQLSSSTAGLPGVGEQADGTFVGVLQGMTAQKAPQGAVGSASAGKEAPAAEKNGENATATAVQDGMSGLLAGLLNALDMSVKPQTTGTEPAAAVPAAGASEAKPQDVTLNADGMQAALLVQMSGSRMLQADVTVVQQAVAALVPGVRTTGGTQPAASLQMNGSRMLQTDGTTAQQAVMALASEIAAAHDDGSMAATAQTAGVEGGQKPAGDEDLLKAVQAALAKDGPLQGLPVAGGASRQTQQPEAPVTEPVAAQPGMIASEQNTLTAKAGTVATERGQASSEQKRSVVEAAPSRADVGASGKAAAEVKAATPSTTPVNVEQQQAVTLPRSASLEAALAGALTQKDGGTAEQTPAGPAAQNAQATGTLPASTGKAILDARSEKAVVTDPAPVAPDAYVQDQAAATTDARVNRTGEGTRSVHAGIAPEAGKKSAELGGETAQTRVERGVVAKAVESASNGAAQSAGDAPTGGEFSSGSEKGAADQFTNGQFHTTAVHQQGKIEGASVASSVSAPVQNNGQRSELSDQIMQQVKDRLVSHEVKTGTDQIVLKLSPENLGDLRVNLSMDGQRLKVEIVAENRMVRDALLQNTDSLKESLARQNISMESFDVTTGDRGAGSPGQGQQQQNIWREFTQQQRQQNSWLASGGYRLPDATAAASQLAYQTPSQHTMVDLHF